MTKAFRSEINLPTGPLAQSIQNVASQAYRFGNTRYDLVAWSVAYNCNKYCGNCGIWLGVMRKYTPFVVKLACWRKALPVSSSPEILTTSIAIFCFCAPKIAFMIGIYCPFECEDVEMINILALGEERGEFTCRRLIYVSPSDRAPASWVPFGMDFEDCVEMRRCKLRWTWVFTWLKVR